MSDVAGSPDHLAGFTPAVRRWFSDSFPGPTAPQVAAWGPILRGDNTLVFAPTGSGKTLAAFLGCLDRLMSRPVEAALRDVAAVRDVAGDVDGVAGVAGGAPEDDGVGAGQRPRGRCRVVYVSPLKALATDVERNLQAPLVGIARCAGLLGLPVRLPTVAVRTGDTDPKARARFARDPADILITTPESLALLLTSKARAALRGVETVIVDEIHALVPTKRGAHLALSLARLERLCGRPLQRIGLSATQRPLDEVARFLGGLRPDEHGVLAPAPVVIADARGDKRFVLSVEDTLVDLTAPGTLPTKEPLFSSSGEAPAGASPAAAALRGTLQRIAPRLVELTRHHRTVLVFANARRVAERLAAAVNDVAGEELAAAHHGALARAQRQVVEERLKQGQIKLLVATSSLELGVDLASVDLVVQVEAPPSVASALQRVGRAGHQVGAASVGIFMPRYPADLIACAATVEAMGEGAVEATHMTDNCLDVLAQHIVGMVAMEPLTLDELYETARRAAPWATLSRASFDSVIALLSGQLAITHGAEGHEGLRGRIVVDHGSGVVVGRPFAQRLAVQNNGTIIDRGLYGVYLLRDGADGGSDGGDSTDVTGPRVGELDEEMVLETRPGEVFRLGASSWRMEKITHDKVLVSPAPGEPGKMPFWRGESLLRPLEFGERMGALMRTLQELPAAAAREHLRARCHLDDDAATRLLGLLIEQKARGGGVLPDDRTFVVERSRDELGDWQVCVLSPLGGRVLQPLGLALRDEACRVFGVDVALSVANDGLLLRIPDGVVGDGSGDAAAPDIAALFPDAEALESLVLQGLAGSAIFTARFREAAGRALLLPKRRPGLRAPLWKQRQRARDLWTAVADVADFPITLEAARETLKDVFDLPALTRVVRELHAGTRRVVTVDVDRPSPLAAAVLAGFVQSALYEGDVPPAERRAQALSIDPNQLRALLGDGVLRELLDDDVIAEVEAMLQRTADGLRARSADQLHDILVRLGDLSPDEIGRRVEGNIGAATTFVDELVATRRAVRVKVGGEDRVLAVEDLGRYRDALGLVPPAGVAGAWLAPTTEPLAALVRRFVRTHAMVTADEVAARFGLGVAPAALVLAGLVRSGAVVQGALRPGGHGVDHACPDVLATIRRRTLTKLRHEVAPVEVPAFARHLLRWHGVTGRGRAAGTGADAVLDAIASLQGTALPLSSWEQAVLPARVADHRPELLDALAAAGEIVWVGSGRGSSRDPWVMLFLADDVVRLWRPPALPDDLPALERTVLSILRERGAMFFAGLSGLVATATTTTTATAAATTTATTTAGAGAGRPVPGFAAWQRARQPGTDPDVLEALWGLVQRGQVTNDTFRPLRARIAGVVAGRKPSRPHLASASAVAFRSRRAAGSVAEGRWSAMPIHVEDRGSLTRRAAAVAEQLLRRDGVLAWDAVAQAVGEGGLPVSTAAVKQALRVLEEAGRVRRGYFVAGLGGMQSALPAAIESLRAGRRDGSDGDGELEVAVVDAVDPAQPCGLQLPWPAPTLPCTTLPQRQAGATVVLVEGRAVALLWRGAKRLLTFLPADEPDRSRFAAAASAALVARAARQGLVLAIDEIDGAVDDALHRHPIVPFLLGAGLVRGAGGYGPARRAFAGQAPVAPRPTAAHGDDDDPATSGG